MKIKSILFLVFFVLFFSQMTGPVQADNLDGQEGFKNSSEIASAYGGKIQEGKNDVLTISARLINATLGLLGIIFTALMVSAGYKYMTAQGNQDKVEEAIKQIRFAVIGLVIILASWGITIFVFDELLKASTGQPWGVNLTY